MSDFEDEDVGAPGSRIRLGLLSMPGREDGPILELYEFPDRDVPDWPFRPGQGHLAFEAEEVERSAARVVEAGGSYLGEIATWRGPSGNPATFVFMRDPEGNLIDTWARGGGSSR